MSAGESSGLADDTLVVCTSNRGDNLGARSLWGKSTRYQESVTVPMIAAGPGLAGGGVCRTPVGLLDLYPTILATLQAICETGRPPLATRWMYWMFDHLEFVLPARTKNEHWPLKLR